MSYLKEPYSAGLIAGKAEPVLHANDNGTQTLSSPAQCPFPIWRFIAFVLWNEGLFKGLTQRLNDKGI